MRQPRIAPYSARTGIVKLRGSFTVASSSKLIRTIGDDIVGHHVVILDFSETDYIDDSAALVIERLIDTAAAEGVRCIVVALDGAPAATLESLERAEANSRRTQGRQPRRSPGGNPPAARLAAVRTGEHRGYCRRDTRRTSSPGG